VTRAGLAFLCLAALGGCRSDETVSGFVDARQVFDLVGIGGGAPAGQATVSFPEPGRISGAGPCNTFAADQTAPYPWFETGPIAATRRACPDLAFERTYFAALEAATIIEVFGDTVILSNDAGLNLVFQAEN
jgi:heat shock protein HslJ